MYSSTHSRLVTKGLETQLCFFMDVISIAPKRDLYFMAEKKTSGYHISLTRWYSGMFFASVYVGVYICRTPFFFFQILLDATRRDSTRIICFFLIKRHAASSQVLKGPYEPLRIRGFEKR